MKTRSFAALVLAALVCLAPPAFGQSATKSAAAPSYPRPLRELNTDYFPFHPIGEINAETWAKRRQDIRDRILLASGLFPLPTKTPLNAVIHGRIERDDYTIDRVFFESFPGHYVTGSLYRPKTPPKDGKMPGILYAHGHWKDARFFDAGTRAINEAIAIGAERWESGARNFLQAACVQLARMGCAVFFYDTLGNSDSIQIPDHRSGRRPDLNGTAPGTFGLYSAAADLRLQSNFGLQTWNTVRALDFLLTVPGVDPERLSCTGASGGATQTMMLAAIDDRLATAFPCVMISTAMQGGCTCENANYLRINQGNIDIAGAFAPKPMGMTAADDWTKELEKKGWPDLKQLWTKLGRPNDVLATFNIHWKHNYNHVSRTTMYGFMNKHFKLGFSEPVFEREFVVSTPAEATVWTGNHPKPTGDKVGGAHEKALLKHWSEDSERVLAGRTDVLARAWQIIIGRDMASANDVRGDSPERSSRGDYSAFKGTIHDERHNESVPYVYVRPNGDKWNGTIALWLANRGIDLLTEAGGPSAAAQKLLDAGIAIAFPTLYLAEAKEQPMNPVKSTDTARNEWKWAAAYTYGYNHSLVAHRVHDAMLSVAAIRKEREGSSARIILVGSDRAGAVAAAAAAMMKDQLAGLVVDTEGFRFAALNDPWDPLFVPGAVKYGDVPGLLSLSDSLKPVVLGEKGAKGGVDAIVNAVLNLAAKPAAKVTQSGE